MRFLIRVDFNGGLFFCESKALEFVERLFGRERQSDEWALIFEDLKSTLETEQLAPELRQAIAGHVTPLLGLVSDER